VEDVLSEAKGSDGNYVRTTKSPAVRHSPALDAMSMIRYPERSVIDALFPAMIARRRGVSAIDTALVHLWGFLGTGEADDGNVAGFAAFSPDDTPTTAGSPILDIATRMMTGMGGGLWGFGLAYRTLADAVVRYTDSPAETTSTAQPDRLQDRCTTEEVWVATIFDARGREYTQVQYVHMPGLEPMAWDSDTLDERSTILDWFERVDKGVISAHVWAAAVALDANRNRSVLEELEHRLLQ
jgi:hypothetical protein